MTSDSVRPPNLTEKLACVLLMWMDAIGDPIPFAEAQQLSADQIVALYEFDHARKRAHGKGQDPKWVNHPTNLTARLFKSHREKTAKRDIPEMRKGDRLAKEHEAFRRAVLAKAGQGEAPAKPRSAFPKGRKLLSGRKLRARNSFQDRRQNGR